MGPLISLPQNKGRCLIKVEWACEKRRKCWFFLRLGIYSTTNKSDSDYWMFYHKAILRDSTKLPNLGCQNFLKRALDQLWERVPFKTKDLTTQLNEKKLICLEENNERKQVILNDKNMYQIATALEWLLPDLINEIHYQLKRRTYWFRTFFT